MKPPRTKTSCKTCVYVGQYKDQDIYVCSSMARDYVMISIRMGSEIGGSYGTAPAEVRALIQPYVKPGEMKGEVTNLYWATLKLRS